MLSPRAALATPYRRAVVGLVLVTFVWRAWTVARWTWQDDDWLFIERSASMPLLPYLMQDYNSHVMPGGLLVTKLMVMASPLNFSVVVGVVALVSALSIALWGRLFERLTGGRMVALLPLAVLALSPVMLRPMMWWACAVTALPLQICMAVMALLACSWVERRRTRDLYLLGLAFVVGLFFWEKCLFATVPTAFVLLAVAQGGLRERLRVIAKPVVLLSAISVPYLAFFLYWTRGSSSSNSVETSFAGQTLGSALSDYGRGLTQVFFPSLLGGPWGTLRVDGDAATAQGPATTAVVVGILLLVVVWLAVRHRGALWLMALPLGYVVLTVGLVQFSSRTNDVWDVVLTDRYYIDGLAVAMLTVVLVIREVAPPAHGGAEGDPLAAGTGRRWFAGAVVAVTVSLLVANVLAAQRVGVRPAREWVETLRQDIAASSPAGTTGEPLVLWDAYAPDDVMPAAFWADHALLSSMLAPVEDTVVFGVASDELWRVSDSGRLETVAVDPAVRAKPGPVKGCGYALSAGEEVVVPMSGSLYFWNWAIQVNGFAAEGVDLAIDLGDREVSVSLPPGLQSRKIQIQGEVPRKIRLRSDSASGTACISEVFAGSVGPVA
ncbi:hypothetical protein [Nocardioides terrigena]|uniref:hypothetical protein n=1 Tax=Nocardioides terrigena TaxID=424797 RepID=UPI000D323478|nr:hypothetical protein [Nocardioides terrigena]